MEIERIQQAWGEMGSNRFLVVYGSGVEDVFIPSEEREINIEQALLEFLQGQGFERIAYIAPHRSIYFLDGGSQTKSSPKNARQVTLPAPDRMKRLKNGPLNERMVLKVDEKREISSPLSEMGDVHALRLLDNLLREEKGCKTAIIFMQAETILRFIDDPRTLAGLVGEWSRLPAINPNKVIFVFSADRYDHLCEVAENIIVPELKSFILRRKIEPYAVCSLVQINGPDRHEITRLFRFMQKTRQVTVSEKVIPRLSEWMEAEGLKARHWIARISELDKITLESTRQKGWFSANQTQDRSLDEQLNDLVGLKEIKDRINELSAWLEYQTGRRGKTKSKNLAHLNHMVFTGNPGTGKTTIARLVGTIYHDFGLLRRGHLVEAKGSDLIAEYVGQTAIKTNRVVDEALDGVLFIDEAYTLTEPERGGYGQEALDTLLTRMEDDRSRLVVIVAGYPEKMANFRNSNPGLSRRFPEENIFQFPDYSPGELHDIFDRMLAGRDIPTNAMVDAILSDVIQGLYSARDETFGNAGEMRNLVDAIERKRAARIIQAKLPFNTPLVAEDIPEKYRRFLPIAPPELDVLFKDLNNLVGLEPIKDYLVQLVSRIQVDDFFRQQGFKGIPVPPLQHLIFTGNPGTGKTTVARLIGKIYHSLGLLSKAHCVEVSRADLVAGYVGQTAAKTKNTIKKAVEGVLFIDEAYTLRRGGENDYGLEAIDMLVKTMDEFAGRLLIIIAGYPREIEQFLNSNPGLSSRFAPSIQFPDYSVDELTLIFKNLADQEGYGHSPDVLQELKSKFNVIKWQDEINFGNARAVKEVFEQMKGRLANRLVKHHIKENITDLKKMREFHFEDLPEFGYQVTLNNRPDDKGLDAGNLADIFYETPLNYQKEKKSVGIYPDRRKHYYRYKKVPRGVPLPGSIDLNDDPMTPVSQEANKKRLDKP